MLLRFIPLVFSLLVTCAAIADTSKSITVQCPGAAVANQAFAVGYAIDSQGIGWVMRGQNDPNINVWPNSAWKSWENETATFPKFYSMTDRPDVECWVGKVSASSHVTGYLPFHQYTSCTLGGTPMTVNFEYGSHDSVGSAQCASADNCPLTCTYID